MYEAFVGLSDYVNWVIDMMAGWSRYVLSLDPLDYVAFVIVLLLATLTVYCSRSARLQNLPLFRAAQSGRTPVAHINGSSQPPPAVANLPRVGLLPAAAEASPKPSDTGRTNPPAGSSHVAPSLGGAAAERLNSASLGLAAKLARAEPADTQSLRDVALACDELAETVLALGRHEQAMAAYQVSLSISERLSRVDYSDQHFQRDLSLSLDNVAHVLAQQRRWNSALERFDASLVIATRLAAVDPGNQEKQRDLSIGQENYADILMALGRRRDAIEVLNGTLAIRETLFEADPGNATSASDLVVALYKLAQAGADSTTNLERALALLSALTSSNPSDASLASWKTTVRDALASLEAARKQTDRKYAIKAAAQPEPAPAVQVKMAPVPHAALLNGAAARDSRSEGAWGATLGRS